MKVYGTPSSAEKTGRSDNAPVAPVAPGRRLKFINMSPIDAGRRILLQFIADDNHVTTIQLEAALAAAFHARLGEVLLRSSDNPAELVRLN